MTGPAYAAMRTPRILRPTVAGFKENRRRGKAIARFS